MPSLPHVEDFWSGFWKDGVAEHARMLPGSAFPETRAGWPEGRVMPKDDPQTTSFFGVHRWPKLFLNEK